MHGALASGAGRRPSKPAPRRSVVAATERSAELGVAAKPKLAVKSSRRTSSAPPVRNAPRTGTAATVGKAGPKRASKPRHQGGQARHQEGRGRRRSRRPSESWNQDELGKAKRPQCSARCGKDRGCHRRNSRLQDVQSVEPYRRRPEGIRNHCATAQFGFGQEPSQLRCRITASRGGRVPGVASPRPNRSSTRMTRLVGQEKSQPGFGAPSEVGVPAGSTYVTSRTTGSVPSLRPMCTCSGPVGSVIGVPTP